MTPKPSTTNCPNVFISGIFFGLSKNTHMYLFVYMFIYRQCFIGFVKCFSLVPMSAIRCASGLIELESLLGCIQMNRYMCVAAN